MDVVDRRCRCVVLTATATSRAQDVPRMPDGKPDFSGIYTAVDRHATGPRNLIFNADKMAPVKPGAESLLYQPGPVDARKDEPRAVCLPSGFPSGMLYILPIQIVHRTPSTSSLFPSSSAPPDHPARWPSASDRTRADLLRDWSGSGKATRW